MSGALVDLDVESLFSNCSAVVTTLTGKVKWLSELLTTAFVVVVDEGIDDMVLLVVLFISDIITVVVADFNSGNATFVPIKSGIIDVFSDVVNSGDVPFVIGKYGIVDVTCVVVDFGDATPVVVDFGETTTVCLPARVSLL